MKISANKYVFIFLSVVVCYIAAHGVIWAFWTKDILSPKGDMTVGDQVRLSYMKAYSRPKKLTIDLPKQHSAYPLINNAEVVTIGDSFSSGGAGGVNPFYQDFIASIWDVNVANIKPLSIGMLETVVFLLESGELERLGTKHIVVESVERSCIPRFAKSIILPSKNKFDIYLEELRKSSSYKYKESGVSFINNLNFKAILYSFLYHFHRRAYFSKVDVHRLERPLFSEKDGKTLLTYCDDIDCIQDVSFESVQKLNDNLNFLQDKLKEKGIELHFMPCVDKYDLYSPYISGKVSKNPFFEYLDAQPKNYHLINTKKILSELVEKNVKDVFYGDDSHWSEIASQAISEKIQIR